MRKKGKITTVYADHFAVQVVLAGMPRAMCQKTGWEPSWNLQRPGGWQLYEELTNQEAEKILDIVEDTSVQIDEVVKKVEAIETKIKFRAFGKTKPSNSKNNGAKGVSTKTSPGPVGTSLRAGATINPCQVDGGTEVNEGGSSPRAGATRNPCQVDGRTGVDEGGSCPRAGATRNPCQVDGGTVGDEGESSLRNGAEEKTAKELLRKQSLALEKAINKVKEGKHGRVGNVFKMREVIEGKKKKAQEPHAIKDPKTGDLIVSSKEIKAVTLQYCVDTLQNNKPDKDYEKLIKLKKELHEKRMEETDGEVDVS